ncbi:putative biogenesis of lysosome-related organelles complex 1 subunit 2 [Apostichopus japonicus]|uniref:Putative biogenesis of lysosome-related organelles complex 1 subunit 2 n=1 Tax=Stichopus japonicus TaxID=307972 RepID=A0A2G8KY56_STIJA|nr:putative biogenesis of lysosome-related organelles complex 1 subunit 2 [Apostichopus japonicus]
MEDKAATPVPAEKGGDLQTEASDQNVITAEEVQVKGDQKQADIEALTRDMFTKLTDYVRGDLASTAEDYKLLEQMNKVTTKKYTDMKQMAIDLENGMKELNEKYSSLQQYLDQIDQIEENTANLEQAALRLDAYSKRLGRVLRESFKRQLKPTFVIFFGLNLIHALVALLMPPLLRSSCKQELAKKPSLAYQSCKPTEVSLLDSYFNVHDYELSIVNNSVLNWTTYINLGVT